MPPLPRTILVGTDFSEFGEAALAYAVSLAQRLDARVHVVHGWQMPPMAVSMEMPAPFTGSLANQLERDAQVAMDQAIAKHAGAKVSITGSVVAADPRDAVVDQAAALKAELVVVGTHGRRGVKRALLGSVAEAVVRFAPCPVLVVRG